MRTTVKSLFTAIILVGTLGQAGLGLTKPASAAASPRCRTSQLTITPIGGSAGVGHVGVEFRLRNHSALGCTLSGYPGAQLLDAHRHPLATIVRWGPGYLSGSRPVRAVYLAPGGDAYFTLEWDQIPSTGETCSVASALLVTPPNAYTPLLALPGAVVIRACGGRLTASPVEPTPFLGFYAAPRTSSPTRYLVLVSMMARAAPRRTAVLFPVQMVYRNAVLDATGSTTLEWVQVIAGGRPVWLYRPNLRVLGS